MEKILISACFLGKKVRYDGKDNAHYFNSILQTWQQQGRLVSICPEMAGGLPAPREGCELVDGRVLTAQGNDFTAEYNAGAQKALDLAKQHHIKMAILKNRSPSCGSEQIYDGTFSGVVIDGVGVTAQLLMRHNIKVFHEDNLSLAQDYLRQLES